MHAFDALTPVAEVIGTLDNLIRAGKIRDIGVSNFPAWPVMQSLASPYWYQRQFAGRNPIPTT